MMTVKELIETLKQLPEDLPIVFMNEHIDHVRILDEFYDRDSANPNCKIIKVVELL